MTPFDRPAARPRPELALEALEDRAVPAILGQVFQDYNANGAFDAATTQANNGTGSTGYAGDRGLAGIAVTATAVNGTTVAGVTDAAGNYSLATAAGQNYRVQFALTNGLGGGAVGSSGSTVQFLSDGQTANLAAVRVGDISQEFPDLVTSCYVLGAYNGAFADEVALLSAPYSAGSSDASSSNSPTGHAIAVTHGQVGSTWGLGYDQKTSSLFAAAFAKKHIDFGPEGIGAIYRVAVPPQGSPDNTVTTASLFANLDTIYGAGTTGTNWHLANGGDFDRDGGDIGWDAVGKSSLGGVDVSADGKRLYVMNLADRNLYALGINAAGGFDGTSYRVSIPGIAAAPGATGAGPLGDLRPFAVHGWRGEK